VVLGQCADRLLVQIRGYLKGGDGGAALIRALSISQLLDGHLVEALRLLPVFLQSQSVLWVDQLDVELPQLGHRLCIGVGTLSLLVVLEDLFCVEQLHHFGAEETVSLLIYH